MQTRPTRPFLRLIGVVIAASAVVAACGGASGPLGTLPVPSSSAEPSVAQGSPDVTPEPSVDETTSPSTEPSGSTGASSPTPSASAVAATTVVRAYFWLDGSEGSAGILAVLRDVPSTKAVATAAVNALLEGPSTGEAARSISSLVPDGTQLLGLTIDGGVATIDLSSESSAGGGTQAYQTRLAQVVYTLTQFPTVKGVNVQIEGAGDANVLNRSDYEQLLPTIWVDRPAWNAAAGNPAHITGSADVFEAAFRVSILDGSGKVLADQQVMATCGTGCRGTFDTMVPSTSAKCTSGTLRVYEPSAKDGKPTSIRDYRIWLTPKS